MFLAHLEGRTHVPRIDLDDIEQHSDDPAVYVDLHRTTCRCGHRHGSQGCPNCEWCYSHSDIDPNWQRDRDHFLTPRAMLGSRNDAAPGQLVPCVFIRPGMDYLTVFAACQANGAVAVTVDADGNVIDQRLVVTFHEDFGIETPVSYDLSADELADYLYIRD